VLSVLCKCIPAVLLSAVLCSCATVDNNNRTMIDAITHFDDSGLKAERIYPALADMIKAEAGAVLILDGQRFEIYKYNMNIPEQREKIERIRRNGEITIVGFKYKVLVNGSFMLLNYQGHPREADIIEAFENFK